VQIVLVDGSLFPFTGKITFAAPSYDSQTGTFLIRVSVNNPDGALRPNQYVRVQLKGAVRPNAILVPQRAVQQGLKGHFVWVVDKDNKVDPRPVVVGDWYGNDWFINEGLKAGEKVVTDGVLTLRPGAPVVVKAGSLLKQ
jgi:membrane fusion protein (multidrug efflux system)